PRLRPALPGPARPGVLDPEPGRPVALQEVDRAPAGELYAVLGRHRRDAALPAQRRPVLRPARVAGDQRALAGLHRHDHVGGARRSAARPPERAGRDPVAPSAPCHAGSTMTPPLVGRRRILLVRACAIVIVLVVTLAAVEVEIRLLVGLPRPERLPLARVIPHPELGWTMMPGDLHYTYDIPVQLNALGYRGPAVSAKAATEYRIVALGDSHVYGQ